jgi:uridine phosphorylase
MMTKPIAPSELIINEDNSIYHLNLQASDIADTIITVGDPDRVETVAKYFDKIYLKKAKREFVTITGCLNGKDITVISSGIGTDNIDIVLNELDALANIDFNTRLKKEKHKELSIYRIGTTGTPQADIPVDSFLVGTKGIGLGGLMHFYDYDEQNPTLCKVIQDVLDKNQITVKPYSANLINGKNLNLEGFVKGMTVSLPGFYGPQGRQLLAKNKSSAYVDDFSNLVFDGEKIVNFEMETSAIYALSSMLGHNAISFSTVLANRANNTFTSDSKNAMDLLIQKVLGIIVA